MKRIVLCIGLALFVMLMGCGKQEEPAHTKEKVKTDCTTKNGSQQRISVATETRVSRQNG